MAIKILMPALSPTMTEGTLSRWLKQEGESVSSGEVIAEIETDKSTMEVEVIDDGVLGKILVPEGTAAVKVNTVIAVLLEEGEDISAIKVLSDTSFNDKIEISQKVDATIDHTALEKADKSDQLKKKIFASPLAKRIAENHKINLPSIRGGTGPGGRIIKDDVLEFIERNKHSIDSNFVSNNKSDLIPVSNMRKAIAERLLESKQTIPHFYLTIDCEVTELLDLRQKLNKLNPSKKISVNDFIVKAAALALKAVPEVNAAWVQDNNNIIRYSDSDISVAVALEEGLITPIIRNADQKSLSQISAEIKELAIKARGNKLKLEEFQGGSITITNLGMYGIYEFSAIINPPQSAILALGKAIQTPVVRDGAIIIGNVIKATLSCDHRVIDGMLGARFLELFKQYMENPLSILI